MTRFTGILLALVSAVSFGTLAIFGRYAYAGGLDTFTLLFLRFTIAAIVMAGLLAYRREALPRRGTLVRLIGMGAIGYAGQSFAYLSAIKFASAGLVALLFYLYPAFVAILSTIFLRAKLPPQKLLALAVATFGAASTLHSQGGQLTGIVFALSAAAIYSVYIMVGAVAMQTASLVQSSVVIFASAAAVFGALTVMNHPHWPGSISGWLAVAAVALIATTIPAVAFLAALRLIGPMDTALLSTVEPVVTVVLAAMCFGETLKSSALLGGGLIIIAVVLLLRVGATQQCNLPDGGVGTPQQIPNPSTRRPLS
jgi:drug/metabolite transporter (DMT)-like permease